MSGGLTLTMTARRNQQWGEDRHQRRHQFDINVARRMDFDSTITRIEHEQLERAAQAAQLRQQRQELHEHQAIK